MSIAMRYFRAGKERIQNSLNKIVLKGNAVSCEMCGWKGIRFPKSICPNCKSRARTRLIPFAVNFFNVPRYETKILHISPNKSEYYYFIKDFSTTQYDRLDIRKYDFINLVQDLTNTTINDEVYDLIILWHVLEHIPEDRKAIREMKRILKASGRILMSAPIYPPNNPTTFEDSSINRSDFLKIHGHHDHCRSCGLDYFKRFEEAGFDTETLSVRDLDNEIIDKFGLSKNHVAWLFSK